MLNNTDLAAINLIPFAHLCLSSKAVTDKKTYDNTNNSPENKHW